jgi:uncharacterized protein with HEPN domain
MPPSAADRLSDILSAIERIERATRGMDDAKFIEDDIALGATERFLGIACEASLRLPEDMKQQAPHIDWREMNNFANLIRHAYRSVDAREVWKIVQNDIPPLKAFVEQCIRDGSK